MYGFRAGIVAAGLSVPFSIAVMGVTPGFAQFINGSGAGATGIGAASNRTLRGAQATPGKAEVAPAPVLPGTKPASEAAAPSVTAADMTPTDTLFDAINRGDLAAARDAINRGANMGGENILGLTPLELSVDLGRNDISFLLLSMRGDDGTSHRPASEGGAANEADLSGGNALKARHSRIAAVATREPAEDPTVVAPRLYFGDGGTPIPTAGFLGFDGGRSAR
jgi:hypothetical protein